LCGPSVGCGEQTAFKLGEDKTERVDLIRTTPTCVLAKTDSGTADVDAILRVQEEW
jgi:hypothetical protein